MLDEKTVLNRLKEILTKDFGVAEDAINTEADFSDDLGLDSVDLVDVLLKLEEGTETNMSPEAFQNIKKVSDVVNYILTL